MEKKVILLIALLLLSLIVEAAYFNVQNAGLREEVNGLQEQADVLNAQLTNISSSVNIDANITVTDKLSIDSIPVVEITGKITNFGAQTAYHAGLQIIAFTPKATVAFAKKHPYTLALLGFMVVFASAALYNLGYMSVQWDEMPHLYGGLLLTRGQTWDYMTTYGYYPPIFDLVTTGYFQIFGANQIAGRLVAVTFSLLAIGLIFAVHQENLWTKKRYNRKHPFGHHARSLLAFKSNHARNHANLLLHPCNVYFLLMDKQRQLQGARFQRFSLRHRSSERSTRL